MFSLIPQGSRARSASDRILRLLHQPDSGALMRASHGPWKLGKPAENRTNAAGRRECVWGVALDNYGSRFCLSTSVFNLK